MIIPKSYDPHLDRIVYLHIPKTAGTSVMHYFRSLVGNRNCGWLDYEFSMDDLVQGNLTTPYKVVGGHFSKKQAETFFPGRNIYLSALRDPKDRALSYYRHVQRTQEQMAYMSITGNFLDDLNSVFGHNLDGQMCWFLGVQPNGSYDSLSDGKTGVSTQSGLLDLLSFVAGRLGMNSLPLPKENVGEPIEVELNDEIEAKLETLLAKDRALYRYVEGHNKGSDRKS